jgi:hypothetical protein
LYKPSLNVLGIQGKFKVNLNNLKMHWNGTAITDGRNLIYVTVFSDYSTTPGDF